MSKELYKKAQTHRKIKFVESVCVFFEQNNFMTPKQIKALDTCLKREETKEKIKRLCWEKDIDEPKDWTRSEVEKVSKLINSTESKRSKCHFCGRINNHDSMVMCDCELEDDQYEDQL
jgi:hypothetical protein